MFSVCSWEAIWVTKPKNRHMIDAKHGMPAAHDHCGERDETIADGELLRERACRGEGKEGAA